MRVKRLELQGFKSFKDKTVIHFDAGVTGIVGPNGCGKSNVVDAFFWSMGEQNARLLRGQAMEDLIFSGSDKSPPAAYAEVSLVLEMPGDLAGPGAPAGASTVDVATQMREVAITRKLYRSGESEYFINKTPSRLRDVQELFMDTGVGSRGYSIIQQGQISKIVQAKPEERRTMIEEVAGIVKYKARRKEAARKLENTQQNLLRVTDVIKELESQKNQLERQVDKARKYREWNERLQSIELRFNALKWEDVSAKLLTLERDLADLHIQDTALSAERETIDNLILTKRTEATSAQKVTEENQNNFMQVSQQLSESENDLRFLQRTLEDLRLSLENLRRESAREEEALSGAEAELSHMQEHAQGVENEYADATTLRSEAETLLHSTRRSYDELLRRVQDLQRRQLNVSNALTEAQNKAEYAELRLLELKSELENLQLTHLERSEAVSSSHKLKETASQNLQAARLSVDSIRQQIQDSSQSIRATQNSIEESRRELSILSSQEVKAKSRLQSLEEHKRRHDQSSQGVQSIFQKILPQSERLKSVVTGTLADHLEVEKTFETAVETSLGRYLDLVLTSDYSAHAELTEALKNQGLGRASLADLINVSAENPQAKVNVQDDQVVGPLSQFVKIATNASNAAGTEALLSQLSQNIYVTQTGSAAQRLATAHPMAVFVSLDGELFRGGWYSEGGDKSQVSGAYVGRNREISELESQVQDLANSILASRSSLEEKESTLVSMESLRRQLEDSLTLAQEAANRAAGEEATIDAQLREAQKSLERVTHDLDRLQQEQTRLSSEAEQAKAKATQLSDEKNSLEQELGDGQLRLETLRMDLDAQQQALMDARVQESTLLEQKNTAQAKLRSAQTAVDERGRRLDYLKEQISRKSLEAEESSAKRISREEEITLLKEALVRADQSFRDSKDLLDRLNNEIEVERTHSQEIMARVSQISGQLTECRVSFERFSAEREQLRTGTFERYALELAEYATSPETIEQVQLLRAAGEETVNEINNEVTLLKQRIHRLGAVNTGAIEEYDAIVERFSFLSTQKVDLEKSMTDLTTTIDRINKVSKERFDRAFHQVNENFQRVFPVIFGGGHASLTLVNPDDFVETGVDIMAQPPGKKPQNINLLSGGEKTLTAISLLFAIFLVKPSPFCLLDEVDAPLDDANIGRFNALLREMSKRSQFIIITHNKRTMELNDKLYGVTMEDAGVSKMVSIQLTR